MELAALDLLDGFAVEEAVIDLDCPLVLVKDLLVLLVLVLLFPELKAIVAAYAKDLALVILVYAMLEAGGEIDYRLIRESLKESRLFSVDIITQP